MTFPRIFGLVLCLVGLALMWTIIAETNLQIPDGWILDLAPKGSPQIGQKKSEHQKAAKSLGMNDKAAGSASEPLNDQMDREPDTGQNLTRIEKAPEVVGQEIGLMCQHFTEQLIQNRIEANFARVDLKFHEARFKTSPFVKRLRSCFTNQTTSKHRAEMDIFSADFKGENAADLIQIQLSVFDKKSKNKVFESGGHFELSTFLRLEKKADQAQ